MLPHPFCELHLHIEGTLEPEMMLSLAKRNGMRPPFASVEEAKAAYDFNSLDDFLKLYYAGCDVLRTRKDFCELMDAYLKGAVAQGIVRAEIFFDPQTHLERGVAFDVFMDGFQDAIDANGGIEVGLIMCFLRHLSPEAALDTWHQAKPFLDRLIAVGLDSSERDRPPELFEQVFQLAAAAGLKIVMHAGEEGPPEYVWSALKLKADRIDHGIRSVEDPALVAELAARQIPLTVCPLSNIALGASTDIESHPFKKMLAQGLCVTINSDDPAYFGGYLDDNVKALELSPEELKQCALNSIDASFASEASKSKWRAQIQNP